VDFSKVREQYEGQAKGPAKLKKLATFTETKLCESMNILQGQLKEEYERKMRGLEESMNSVKEDLERERGAVGGYKTEMEETVKKLAVVQAKDVELERDVKEKSKTIEDLTLESNATRKLMEDFQIKAKQLEAELAKKENELQEAKDEKDTLGEEVKMFEDKANQMMATKKGCLCTIS